MTHPTPTSGECQECLRLQAWVNVLNSAVSDRDVLIAKKEEENKKLSEALEICLKELMYKSTTGHWWMWARGNEAVPERLMQIRKLLEP